MGVMAAMEVTSYSKVIPKQGFMQDQIIASHTSFGGPMDINCYCLLSQFTIFFIHEAMYPSKCFPTSW